MMTQIKTSAEIVAMRESGAMLATVLEHLRSKVEPGTTTKELANIAAVELRRLGGEPAFLGYQGFPDVLCVSINDEVVHGIPRTDRVVANGDIVSLDFGVRYRGMITDGAISLQAGRKKDEKITTLIKTTEDSLLKAVDVVKKGTATGDIGSCIQKTLESQRYGVVRDLVGHGVGHQLHEEPNIPNYGRPHTGTQLKANMTIAIEPMATLGDYKVYVADDGWTVKTWDGSWAAHFEHTILITDAGAEILTKL